MLTCRIQMCMRFVCVSEQAEKPSVASLEGKMMTYGISFQWFALVGALFTSWIHLHLGRSKYLQLPLLVVTARG